MSEKSSFPTQQAVAEDAARQLIYSWAESGRTATSDLPPEQFPNATLSTIAAAVAWASDQRIRGMSDILTECFLDAPEGIRPAFIECCEGMMPASPEHCRPLVEKLHAFHVERRKREIADKIRQALDQGEEIDGLLAELVALEAGGTADRNQPFPIVRAGNLEGAVEARDFVETLLTEGGASVVYGPSNCGKSFWTMDLCASVATGRLFRDELECEQGAVIYVALEGSHGARNRIQGLRQAGSLPESAPLYLCFAPLSLLEPGHAARLAASVKLAGEQSEMPCRLVVLDTLARAMAGGDENKGQDMGEAVRSIDAIRAATGAHVMLVHHCGKNEALGARGHSSLRAAVDTEIEISRPEGDSISTVRVTKQRDLPPGEPMPFSLAQVTLGTDSRGKPITSCTVHHEAGIMASTAGRAGRKPTCTANDMLRFLPADNVKDWHSRVKDETGLGQSQFYTHKAALELGGKICRETSTHRIIAA